MSVICKGLAWSIIRRQPTPHHGDVHAQHAHLLRTMALPAPKTRRRVRVPMAPGARRVWRQSFAPQPRSTKLCIRALSNFPTRFIAKKCIKTLFLALKSATTNRKREQNWWVRRCRLQRFPPAPEAHHAFKGHITAFPFSCSSHWGSKAQRSCAAGQGSISDPCTPNSRHSPTRAVLQPQIPLPAAGARHWEQTFQLT